MIPGIYSFRLSSHLSDLTVDYEKTSTYLKGLFSFNVVNNVPQFTQNISILDNGSAYKEVIIDVTLGDFNTILNPSGNTTRMLVIEDLWINDDSVKGNGIAQAFFGYIYENSTAKVPIENIKLLSSWLNGEYIGYCDFTDHNGFYYISHKIPSFDVIYVDVAFQFYIYVSGVKFLVSFLAITFSKIVLVFRSQFELSI